MKTAKSKFGRTRNKSEGKDKANFSQTVNNGRNVQTRVGINSISVQLINLT